MWDVMSCCHCDELLCDYYECTCLRCIVLRDGMFVLRLWMIFLVMTTSGKDYSGAPCELVFGSSSTEVPFLGIGRFGWVLNHVVWRRAVWSTPPSEPVVGGDWRRYLRARVTLGMFSKRFQMIFISFAWNWFLLYEMLASLILVSCRGLLAFVCVNSLLCTCVYVDSLWILFFYHYRYFAYITC